MLLKLSKEIRQYLLKDQITVTAEYLPFFGMLIFYLLYLFICFIYFYLFYLLVFICFKNQFNKN